MKNYQVFTSIDPLKDYKLSLIEQYNCMFFEHNTNSKLSINCGMKNLNMYHEKIITDGNIKVISKNSNKPSIVCEEKLITFDNGLSLLIEISNSTFFINILRKNNEILYEIHMYKESKELIDKIINYIYNNRIDLDTLSIALYYPNNIKLAEYEQNIKVEKNYFYSEKKKCLKLKKR